MEFRKWASALVNKISFGNSANVTDFETSGTMVAKGEATCWDDFWFSVNNLRVNPATLKPDFSETEVEYLFDPSSTETIVGSRISEHRFKVAPSVWIPHVHWAQSAAGHVVWQLEYKMWGAGAPEPSWTTITNNTSSVFTYTSGTIQQISEFPPINMSSTSLAINVKIRLSRLGANVLDTYALDARFMGFDFHVPIDMLGSHEEYVK